MQGQISVHVSPVSLQSDAQRNTERATEPPASFQPQLQTRREALWRHATNPAPWSYGSEMIHLNHIHVKSPAV